MGSAWDYAHMSNAPKSDEKERRVRTLIERIDERRAMHGLSDNEVSNAGGNRYIMRDLRGRGSIPSSDKLANIAALLGVSSDWLMGRTDDPSGHPVPVAVIEALPAGVGDASRLFREFPKNLPIYGTAFGHNMRFDDNGSTDIEVTLFEPSDVVGYARRPPALEDDKEAFGFYIQGDSMFPAHKPGAFRIASTKKPPRITDDVIVQLRAPIDDGEEVIAVLIKTLVKRTAEFIELSQYNPPMTFRVPNARIAKIYLVEDPGDLLSR